mgnify:CR=1 FL=1
MKHFILIILLICPLLISSQELNCQVTVVTDAKLEVTSVEQEIFKQLNLYKIRSKIEILNF